MTVKEKTYRVRAKTDTISIVAGHEYEWTPHELETYQRYNEQPPRVREGKLTGIGGVAPTCIAYPASHLVFLDDDFKEA